MKLTWELPQGYTITRTEQWEWTLKTPTGAEFSAASEYPLIGFAMGIEHALDKKLAKKFVELTNSMKGN
jgi:hypothetical protein